MNLHEALALGIVQGLTEFLPVSSSGHLVLLQRVFGLQQNVLLYDVLLHLGTLVAVLAVFWQDFLGILKKPFSRLTYLLIVGTIPAAVLGLALQDFFDRLFKTGQTIGVEFLITGLVIWVVDKAGHGRKSMERVSYLDAAVIGTAQGLAIFPAISRSGLTIAGSLLRGLDRRAAARFSFLLSAPAILGAAAVEGKDLLKPGYPLPVTTPMLWGTLAAAVAGYLAIRIMLRVITRGSLKPFSYYVWALGLLVLLDQFTLKLFFPPLFK